MSRSPWGARQHHHTPVPPTRKLVGYIVHRSDGTPEMLTIPQRVPFEGSYRAGRGRATMNTESAMHDRGEGDVMIFAVEEWLAAACWCDTEIVGVPQREVVQGVTRSCGRSLCRNPATGDQTIGNEVSGVTCTVRDGLCVHGPAKLTSVEQGRPGQNPARRGGRTRAMPRQAKTLTRRHYNRPPADVIDVRRDLVEMLWEQKKSSWNIALELEITMSTVSNDLTWLRKQGRI